MKETSLNRFLKTRGKHLCIAVLAVTALLASPVLAASLQYTVSPVLSLLLNSADDNEISEEGAPSLVLMAATGDDSIQLAWTEGGDGISFKSAIRYSVHLSTDEAFTVSSDNLVAVLTDEYEIEVSELDSDTIYYAKVVALSPEMSPQTSNLLQVKTLALSVEVDGSQPYVMAEDLGLGCREENEDGSYTFTGGAPPQVGDALFSENEDGEITLRRVEAVNSNGDTHTVEISELALNQVLNRAEINATFYIYDGEAEGNSEDLSVARTPSSRTGKMEDGNLFTRRAWKNNLLVIEKTSFSRDEPGLRVVPGDNSSIVEMTGEGEVQATFKATVDAKFKPELITTAKWGGTVAKHLDSAKIAAKGTLTMQALAEFDFSAEGSVTKEFELFETTWRVIYPAGPVPVYQEITRSMAVEASAEAEAEIKAMAEAHLTEVVEIGARYNGTEWETYIVHDENKSLTASLDIVGKVGAEIRLVPKIEVEFYKLLSSSLTVEPLAASELTFASTTQNSDFI